MTSAYVKHARKTLRMTQDQLAAALELSPKCGNRTIRLWETPGSGTQITGPARVALRFMLAGVSK